MHSFGIFCTSNWSLAVFFVPYYCAPAIACAARVFRVALLKNFVICYISYSTNLHVTNADNWLRYLYSYHRPSLLLKYREAQAGFMRLVGDSDYEPDMPTALPGSRRLQGRQTQRYTIPF